jgi:hypothetical protein
MRFFDRFRKPVEAIPSPEIDDYELERCIGYRLCICVPKHAWFCHCNSAYKAWRVMELLKSLEG